MVNVFSPLVAFIGEQRAILAPAGILTVTSKGSAAMSRSTAYGYATVGAAYGYRFFGYQ